MSEELLKTREGRRTILINKLERLFPIYDMNLLASCWDDDLMNLNIIVNFPLVKSPNYPTRISFCDINGVNVYYIFSELENKFIIQPIVYEFPKTVREIYDISYALVTTISSHYWELCNGK
jgi:hypothetical protein